VAHSPPCSARQSSTALVFYEQFVFFHFLVVPIFITIVDNYYIPFVDESNKPC